MSTAADTVLSGPSHTGAAGAKSRRRGIALAVIAGAQLMVVLDATIVNIALPHIRTALDFSDTGLSWVLNAYTLTFGGLLLLGGRAGDILGRRRVFVSGILLFTLASLVGGFAQSSGWLLAARAVQGVGGAIASPTALALIATNFREGPERNRAFGVFAAVSGSGAALGMLAGGMLTSWVSWRWVLFVNAPIGVAIALLAPLYISESERHPGRFDVGGAITSTGGMAALVYGFIHASESSWGDRWTVGAFAAAVALLAAFAAIELRHSQPIVPLRMFRDRSRASTYAIMLSFAAGMMGMFFFLTLFVQNVLDYSPLKAGLAFLPVSAVIMVAAQASSRLLIRVGAKTFMISGAALATLGLFLLSQLSAATSYLGLLGPMALFGAGMGFLFVPLTVSAVAGVEARESGAASALLNVMQQVGGSLGLSILVTVFSTAQQHERTAQIKAFLAQATPDQRQAFAAGKLSPPADLASHVLSHGISTAFTVAIVFGAIGFVLALLTANAKPAAEPGAPAVGETVGEAAPEPT